MKDLIENMKALGARRLAMLGVVGAVILGGVLLGATTVFAPVYTPLYSQVSPAAASQMVQSLEQSGIPVRLSRNGDIISVPEGDLARARMAIADSGLPSEGTPGWELFDDMSGMGMNTFMQRVNKLRALEGELARSIQTINGIEAARVHLVLPEREAFSRERAQPSASVIVRTGPNRSLSRRHGQAIQALVASAVADLDTSGITVLSATGETIVAEEDTGSSDTSLTSQRAEIEERLEASVASILNARVGPGNARVRVSVDLTNEREVRRTTSYDPGQQVARSVETRSQSSDETDPADGAVDAGNNIPEALQDEGGGGQGTRSTNSSDEIINYEIGTVQSETVREPGDIERITVAVLVNGLYEEVDGETVFNDRSPEELARLENLVKTAIGFSADRGDEVQIDSLEFRGYDGDLTMPTGGGVGGFVSDNATTMLRAVFGLAAIAMVLFLGRQPLRMVLDAALPSPEFAGVPAGALEGGGPSQADGGQGQRALPQGQSAPRQITGPTADDQRQLAGEVLNFDDPRGKELVQVASVDGGVARSQLKTVSAMAEQYPDEALRVLNSWLTER
ncbi:flagellar basal-body MS-ring/collar protein FliF [Palleronia pelagia]|uniref:Flagellar M-ring protein n=1 Tax=Palleronia pelagia TaxID=387096 RepID=A0A1H8F1R9_9RHOB|nr:flagellar basal-body MS-ring/collar protein FliF [Palleronia pelagia]SEN25811.1 flagellar M-ring protein FliF [Palleronia pelagia]